MGTRIRILGLGALALGFAGLALVILVRSGAGPQPAAAQLPELEVTISPASCGEVAVAASGADDTAFVYTTASPSTWAAAADAYVELRARAKAGCTFSRWVATWLGADFPFSGTTARIQFLEGMTATAYFTGTPATPTPTPTPAPTPTPTPPPESCTQTTLGADPAANAELAADCNALLAAKGTLAGAATLNWSADTAMTDWDGVTLGGTPQRVTGLSLMLRGLTGTIPPGLGGLTELRSLNLSWNKLRGAVPAGLAGLTELHTFDLSRNRLTGSIPEGLGDLERLEHLTLSQNFLDGEIPAALARLSKLEGLYLYQNRLKGSIPPELEGLPVLAALFLGENELGGCVPRALRRVARNDLATLGLASCALPATTLLYGTYDATGAVTAPGSYAFLAEGEEGEATAVTTYEGLRDGTATSLLIHQSDAAGTSRAEVYEGVEAGDLVEWKDAVDCFVRYRVAGTSVDGAARQFEVRPETYAFESCQSGSPGTDPVTVTTASALPLEQLGGTSLRDFAVVHGMTQLVPPRTLLPGGDAAPDATVAVEPTRRIEPTALALSVPEARTSDAAVARELPYWREPRVPAGWRLSQVRTGSWLGPGEFYGYGATYRGPENYIAFRISAAHVLYTPWSEFASSTADSGRRLFVREPRIIAGRPAVVGYSPLGSQHDAGTRVFVDVWDADTGAGYSLEGLNGSLGLRGGPEAAERLVAIACSLFWSEAECARP